ncbi:DUF4065 domain-containing protein [bacterium]|nr:DUF4065 domain-containing protein [bacterium]
MSHKNKVFCEECRKDVDYVVNQVSMIGKIKEKEYAYMGMEVKCADCGSFIFVPEVNDMNLKALYDVYREKNGIVPLETILAIPEKYDIGKRPLSLMLGWGEQTFTRYCDGDMPTKQYSDILIRIYSDPAYFLELLNAGREKLTSRSYEKSKKAVDALLKSRMPAKSKIEIVIKYVLNQCEDITPLALQKALYYIQGFYCAFYGTFLFQDDCQAWVHGPVYKDIYLRYKNYRFDPIGKSENFDVSVFSSGEKAICDSVIQNICCYSGKVLERFTHNETPWLAARCNLPVVIPSDRIIEKSLIKEYFDAVKHKYNMVNPSDIKSYAEDMFNAL